MGGCDVGSIAQLIKEVTTLEQQLQTAEATLANAAATSFRRMTGGRGMQSLLSGTTATICPRPE